MVGSAWDLHHPPTWSSPERSTHPISGTSTTACCATITGGPAEVSTTPSVNLIYSQPTLHSSPARIRMPAGLSLLVSPCRSGWADRTVELDRDCGCLRIHTPRLSPRFRRTRLAGVNLTEASGCAMRKPPLLGLFCLTTAVVLACGDKLMLIMLVRLAQLRIGHLRFSQIPI